MVEFTGNLKLPGERGSGLAVQINLDDGVLDLRSPSTELGNWPLEQVLIHAEPDGFHLRVQGEEAIITTNDDPAFALAVGLRHAPPLLRRRMADLLRHDAPDDH